MELWEAVVLGLIQGLTEFLPVSSSGHLVLAEHVLAADAGASVTFEVFLHFGTALSIIVLYRQRIAGIATDFFKALARPVTFSSRYRESEHVRTAVLIALTMVPTGIVYLAFKDFLESRFEDPVFVCYGLLATGILLLLTVLRRNPGGRLGPARALLMGCAQAMAMLPGVSRSGATICSAIYANTDAEEAANFSFLMLLPVVVIATVIKGLETFSATAEGVSWSVLVVGALVSFGSGVVAIKALLGVVRRGKLAWFAIYCFLVGGIGLAVL